MAKRRPKTKRSNCHDPELREVIAWRIGEGRKKTYPRRGGLTKCAREFGISPQQWSQYESGNRSPEDRNLEQIAKHLNTTVEKLMTPPGNWAAVRTEWLDARFKAQKKPAKAGRQKTAVEQVRASLKTSAGQISSTDESHDAIPTANTELRHAAGSGYRSHSSKTMEVIQKIINVDMLRAEGKISTEDLANTLKSVDVLIDALCREVTR